jgi:AsmA-like C-terminal region
VNPPDQPRRSAGRRWFRICFRTGVRSLVFALLALSGLVLYLHEAGFPSSVKRSISAELKRLGVVFDCERLRLRFYGGIVADGATLRRAGPGVQDSARADEVALGLDWSPLLQFSGPTIRRLTLRQGRFTLPLQGGPGDGPSYLFSFDVARANIRILDADAWELEWLDATTHGARIRATGSLTNLTRTHAPSETPGGTRSRAWQGDLERLGRFLDGMAWKNPPELNLAFRADIRHPERSTANLGFSAGGVRLSGADIGSLKLFADVRAAATTNDAMFLSWRLDAGNARGSGWGAKRLQFSGTLEQNLTNSLPRTADWRLEIEGPAAFTNSATKVAAEGSTVLRPDGIYTTRAQLRAPSLKTPWGVASGLNVSLTANHPQPTNSPAWRPDMVVANISASAVRTQWGEAQHVAVVTRVVPVAGGAWVRREAWAADAEIRLTNVMYRDVVVPAASASVSWAAPVATIRTFDLLSADGGRLHLDGSYDTAGARAEAGLDAVLDPRPFQDWLGPGATIWLAQFGWADGRPPRVRAHASVTVPPPGTADPEARLMDTLKLEGLVEGTNAGYRGAFADLARVPFANSNHMWLVTDAAFTTKDGVVLMDYQEWIGRKDYHFHIRGLADPKRAAPALGPGAVRALRDFQFDAPAEVDADYWGRWRDLDRSGVSGWFKATNVVFRGERALRAAAGAVTYTNNWAHVSDASLVHASGPASVGGLDYDVRGKRLFFTNATAALDPTVVARAIGPRTAATFAPYEFPDPPAVRFGGWIPLEEHGSEPDAWFETKAPRFKWWKLRANAVDARLAWKGDNLSVTNASGGFHEGRFWGSLFARLADARQPLIWFEAGVTNVQVKTLLEDITGKTNRLEGMLSGRMAADVQAWTNGLWSGRGEARLRDGLLWDMPLFGPLSTLLDQINPGLGQMRFSSGASTFSVTNREVRTDDLELRSPAMRLELTGKVDFEARVDGRVEAELLRDVPLVGPLVSLALKPFTKLFEYDMKGTLGKPAFEMSHVPAFILAPLRPFHWIKALITAPAASPSTNGPPTSPP